MRYSSPVKHRSSGAIYRVVDPDVGAAWNITGLHVMYKATTKKTELI